jgi:glycine cleavage system H protein
MSTKPMKIRESVSLAALGLSIVVLLPLVAVAAFVLRAGLFAGALLAVMAGMVTFAVSPRFREWLGFQVEPGLTYNGLRLDTGVALGDGHAWARFDGGEATVGADDLVGAVLGPVEQVDLPGLGTRVRRGEPLFRLRHGDRTVAVASPIAGTVVHANVELADSPHLVNEAPFDAGWAVRLGSDDPRLDREVLRHGAKARSWFRGEVDGLLADLLPTHAGAVPALPDGGELVEGLHRYIDDATWSRLQARFFTPAERSLS